MSPRNANPTLLLGIAAIVFFLISLRLRHPLLLIGSGALVVITYQRFRGNYIEYRKRQTKFKRQEGSIEVESSEVEDINRPQ